VLLNRYYDIFCKSNSTAPLQTLFQYIPEHFSGKFWDGYQFVPHEIYKEKLFTITQPRSPIPTDEPDASAASAAWKEDQVLLSTLDSFKLTSVVEESMDTSRASCVSPSCGFILDISPESVESLEAETNHETVPVISATDTAIEIEKDQVLRNGIEQVEAVPIPMVPETISDSSSTEILANANTSGSEEKACILQILTKVMVDIVAAETEIEPISKPEILNGSTEDNVEKVSPCSSWKEWKGTQVPETTKKRKASEELPVSLTSPVHRQRYFQADC